MLSDLSQAHRESLRACGEFRRFEKGQKLLTQGAKSSNLLIVLDGEIELSRDTPYGDFVLNRVGPQSLLGDVLYCCQQPRATDAIALSEGELLVAKPKALQLAFSGHDGFEVAMLWQFWRSLSAKLRHVNAALEVFFRTEEPEKRTLRATPQRLSKFDVNQRRHVFRKLGLSNMEVNFLASVAQACELAPHECLFRQGDPSDCLYVVADGRLMVSKEIPGAGTEALAFVEPGQIVGEMGVVDGLPRTADAFTMASTTTLLRLHPDTLAKVLHPEKTTSIRLLRYLCHQQALRVHATYEKIVGWFLLSGGQTS